MAKTLTDEQKQVRKDKMAAKKIAKAQSEVPNDSSKELSVDEDTNTSELKLEPLQEPLREFYESKIPLKILTITERTPISISKMLDWYWILTKAGVSVTKRDYDTSLHFKINGHKFKLAWICKSKLKKNPQYRDNYFKVIEL